MPNTIAHIAVNGFGTKALIKNADIKWVYLGILVPDFPWIIQRSVSTFFSVNLFDLRTYAIIQATFLFSLALSLAFSFFAKEWFRIFLILSLGVFLHLLLDSLQIKWANGVHFLAPFSWKMTSFNLFWPENIITYILIITGVIFYIINWKKSVHSPLNLAFSFKRAFLFISVLLVYLILPLFLFSGPLSQDNHFISTIKNTSERTGKYVEFDRVRYVQENAEGYLLPYFKEKLFLTNFDYEGFGKISMRGRFVDEKNIEVIEYHEHFALWRDSLSYIGIVMILLVWIFSVINEQRVKKQSRFSRLKS